jgi:hypothetical protein
LLAAAFRCFGIWVFMDSYAYRDSIPFVVVCRFHCAASADRLSSPQCARLQRSDFVCRQVQVRCLVGRRLRQR